VRVQTTLQATLYRNLADAVNLGMLAASALSLAAEAVLRGVVEETTKDRYEALRDKVAQWAARYVDALEKRPSSKARAAILSKVINSRAADDRAEVRALTAALLAALNSSLDTTGIDIGRLEEMNVQLKAVDQAEAMRAFLAPSTRIGRLEEMAVRLKEVDQAEVMRALAAALSAPPDTGTSVKVDPVLALAAALLGAGNAGLFGAGIGIGPVVGVSAGVLMRALAAALSAPPDTGTSVKVVLALAAALLGAGNAGRDFDRSIIGGNAGGAVVGVSAGVLLVPLLSKIARSQFEEAGRFTDLTLYEGHLFPGDDPAIARRLPDSEALRACGEYTLEVAIRRERSGIAVATPATRAVLNPRRTTEPLSILVVARPLHGPVVIDECVATIDWPYDADSGPAFFRIRVPDTLPESVSIVTIEVRLYHANLDLLDVVNLSLCINAATETKAAPSSLYWPRSSKAEPRLDPDTALRNLTIRVSPAVEGYKLEFIFLREDRTISLPLERHVTAGDLEALLTKVRDFWTELVITNYESRLSVTLTTWTRYLKRLNELGAEAWELLFGSRTGSQKGASETIGDLLAGMDLAAGTHVQITYDRRITDFVFPWSILYPPMDPGTAVDPFFFWGAKYQVEQVWEGSDHDQLEVEPVDVAVVIDPGFGEVQPELDMFESFRESADGRIKIDAPINNRQDLFKALTGLPSRHFYYFFCHGYAPAGPPILRRDGVKLLRETVEALPPSERKPWDTLLDLTAFMADEAWMFIGNAQITESELRRSRNFFRQRRPILFLNMCHSAALAPSMTRGLLRLFLDRDATAVIGTEGPMTSVFAHAFAREFLKHLFGGSDLGTALWRARRHFLADEFRNPLGFAYTLYGRATAKLGTSRMVTGELT
jgi:hypothetical protein